MAEQTNKGITKRQPVIVVMGHIDHGKSTLLDYIRKANVADREVGGITQHMGAYEASYTDKAGTVHTLTFIDTPGHEAFGAIRARASRAADIAILIVSGEDGVKPQTLEALACIRKEKLPFIVAINKMDKPGADVERTKASLAEHEVYVEGYGGDVPWVAISALKGTGTNDLIEMLLLVAELADLTTDASKPAAGTVIEGNIDPKKGKMATLIIKNGTLSVGTTLVSGSCFTPVRSIEDYTGASIKSAAAGRPVRIVGWNEVPVVGDAFTAFAKRKDAEELAAEAAAQMRSVVRVNETVAENAVVVPMILKTDTVGTLEAVKHEIAKIAIENVVPKVLVEGVGTISENDIKTVVASASPIIIGFNVKIDSQARALAERSSIPIMQFDIIYRLSEWLAEELAKRKPKVETQEETGRAKVIKLFSSDKGRYVIGGKVELGTITSGATVKIIRRETEIAEGKIKSLQQLKTKVDEVGKDKEFGAQIESKIEPAPGDRIAAFITVTK